VLVFVNPQSDVIKNYGRNTTDLILFEFANFVHRQESNPELTLGSIFQQTLKEFPDERQSDSDIRKQMGEVLSLIRQRVAPVVREDPEKYWGMLEQSSRERIEGNAIATGKTTPIGEMAKTGEFAEVIDWESVLKIFTECPEDFLDGKVFKAYWGKAGEESARIRATKPIVRSLETLKQSHEQEPEMTNHEKQLTLLSCSYLIEQTEKSGEDE